MHASSCTHHRPQRTRRRRLGRAGVHLHRLARRRHARLTSWRDSATHKTLNGRGVQIFRVQGDGRGYAALLRPGPGDDAAVPDARASDRLTLSVSAVTRAHAPTHVARTSKDTDAPASETTPPLVPPQANWPVDVSPLEEDTSRCLLEGRPRSRRVFLTTLFLLGLLVASLVGVGGSVVVGRRFSVNGLEDWRVAFGHVVRSGSLQRRRGQGRCRR